MKTNLTLRQVVRQENNKCGDCDGDGMKINFILCKPCNGKGYIEPLEIGCEVYKIHYTAQRGGEPKESSRSKHLVLDQNYGFDGQHFYKDGYVTYNSNNRHYPEFHDRFLVVEKFEDSEFISYENLGKPLTYRELIFAMTSKGYWTDINMDQAEIKFGAMGEETVSVDYDIENVEDQDEEVLLKLIKLLS